MIRALLVGLVALLALEAFAQTFPVPGPGHLPWTAGGGGGGGGAGIEARCTELGANCIASEPMNTPTFTSSVGGDSSCTPGLSESVDFDDSTGAKELGHVLHGCGGVRMVPATGDAAVPNSSGPITHVMKLVPSTDTNGATWMAKSLASGGYKRACMRVYRKHSSPFAGFNACGAHKIQEMWWGGATTLQTTDYGGRIGIAALGSIQEGNYGSLCTGDGTPYQCCFGPGDGCYGQELRGNARVYVSNCTSNWCRFEMCVSAADLNTGTGISVDGVIRQVGVASPIIQTTPPFFTGNGAGGGLQLQILNDYRQSCTTGTDYTYSTHGMVAAWTTDTGQTIGAACEVEGGC